MMKDGLARIASRGTHPDLEPVLRGGAVVEPHRPGEILVRDRTPVRRAGVYRIPSSWIPRTKYRWVNRNSSAIGSAATTPATIWYGQLIS